ncbi:MAG: multifunctional oxoglutarate decarboxylase/oxoglutarate dehydrogenase thiamine pyrophosphate-binding subunit/dihydrolipoyllysine-residue succinyltransferase subunit [Planctomycetota bacterium]
MSSFGSNSGYIDDLYEQFQRDPDSVSPAWREFFEGHEAGDFSTPDSYASDEELAPHRAPIEGKVESIAPEIQPPSRPAETPKAEKPDAPPESEKIVGASARIVENMETSLGVPTATTVRTVPVKLLEENRRLINLHQQASAKPKVSYTHLIAWALVKAMAEHPTLYHGYEEIDGKPHRIRREKINFGVAIDVEKKTGGGRMLYVPSIKDCGSLSFEKFFAAFNDLIARARRHKLTLADFEGTGVSITNPGMLGTVLSVPRLMDGQGSIIGIGSIGYPPHCAGMTPDAIAQLGLSKVMTLTSTYDHRIIQGAESGAFLATVEQLLLGANGFYHELFDELSVPMEAMDWASAEPTAVLDAEGNELNLTASGIPIAAAKQAQVLQMIRAFRVRGHLMASLDPLGSQPDPHPELELYSYGLSIWDLDRTFICDGVGGHQTAKLRDILDVLRRAYCQYSGVEYMHITDPEKRSWLQRRVEAADDGAFTVEDKLQILEKLNAAEAFEKFVGKSYIGQKRFSLEGCESIIPAFDALLNDAERDGVEDVVIGMAHRGRLNVLVNVVGKSFTQVFQEFEDVDPSSTQGSGDVKYHLGMTGTYESRSGGELRVTLASNPSHLESVNPVVEGMVRAMQDQRDDEKGAKVLPVLVHGDAAFAGQGVVFETLNFSQLEGYRTGGTVHIIINNQIGFTTGPEDARSSHYATDVAKSIGAPIFHVNADHPQSAVRVIQDAFAFRQAFGQDVVVDIVGYRLWGHNEGDEPALTQPMMYEKIRSHRSVRKLCMERLLARGEIDVETGEKLLEDFHVRLESALEEAKSIKSESTEAQPQPCLEHKEGAARPHVETGVDRQRLESLLDQLVEIPDGFDPHPKLTRLFENRRKAFDNDKIDWGLAESLAFATLVDDGVLIRLSGEDSGRGTFNHRHARVHDASTGESYVPLANLTEGPGDFEVYNSLLSEFGVLGFDYGYSVAAPEALVLWEAQFGDFVNGAQVIIDQYISSGEEKWGQKNSLVMLLPHGYEGQGPEHSSARLERFLQLASEGNMQVVNATTAAQYFHLLRRQVAMDERKPLIVMTPKSLLRLPAATSTVSALAAGSFEEVIDDHEVDNPDDVERVVLCSGKVYYDLVSRRSELELGNVAVVRVEQFYPFPADSIGEILERYSRASEVVWLQEEPRNMGGWDFVDERLELLLSETQRLSYVGRPWSASPATGSNSRHLAEQKALVEWGLTGELAAEWKQPV